MTTILPITRTSAIPAGFEWHQSSVSAMLRCPRQFQLRYVDRVPLDHRAGDYANLLGTADHAGIEYILGCANEFERAERGPLLDVVMEAFQEALYRAQEHGEHTDPDGLDRACERIEGERIERLLALSEDKRIRDITWKGIEWKFQFTERGGRKWKGALDAWGVALYDIPGFGLEGREPVFLRRLEPVLVDWKTGIPQTFSHVERALSVQLGTYGMALNRTEPAPWRTFLAYVQDLDRPKAPTNSEGKRIPKKLPKVISQAFCSALELNAQQAAASKRRPRDADNQPIPKWEEERINPEWEAACSKPKGPLFREARVDYPRVLHTIRAAISQAEAGLFPASGAATGQCSRCSYRTICTTEEVMDVSA